MYNFKCLLFLLSGLLICSTVKPQEETLTIRFPNTPKSTSTEGSPMNWIIKDFGNDLNYNDSPVMLTFPDNFHYEDTGLIDLYFIGSNDTLPFPRNTHVLIGGYKKARPTLYVDFNNNLDFSDDGPGKRLSKEDTTVQITLRNAKDSKAIFVYEISPLTIEDSTNKAKIKKQFEGKEHIADLKYWLSDKRLNCRITTGVFNGDSVEIGIRDYNCNGYFNDSLEDDHDRIMIAGPNQSGVSSRLNKGAYLAKPGRIIEIGDQNYKLLEVHPYGKYVKLKPTNESSDRISEGDKIPDFELSTFEKDTFNLYKKLNNDQYTIIDVWGSWCPGCWNDCPDLKALINDFPDKLKVLGLNWGDSKESAMKFKQANDVPWFNGKASKKFINTLLVDGYPYYILVGPKKKILAFDPKFKEVRAIINKRE